MTQRTPVVIDGTAGAVQQLQASDTLAPAALGTGTRNGSNFLRDDGTWAAPGSSGITLGQAVALTSFTPFI